MSGRITICLQDFRAFWHGKLDGPLYSVIVAHSRLIKPAEFRAIERPIPVALKKRGQRRATRCLVLCMRVADRKTDVNAASDRGPHQLSAPF
jgi:hypothetical protein